MSDRFFTTLSQAVVDDRITGEEFSELEKTLFEGDGIINEVEYMDLEGLVYPYAVAERLNLWRSVDQYIFEDPKDFQRMALAMDHGALSLERYVQLMKDFDLGTKNDEKELLRLSSASDISSLSPIRIEAMGYFDDGTFLLTLSDSLREVTWHYRGEADMEMIDLSLGDFTLYEVVEVLIDFRKKEEITEEEKKNAESILRKIQELVLIDVEGDQKLQKEIQELLVENNYNVPLIDNYKKDRPVLREEHRLPPIFYGLPPSEEIKEALVTAFDHFEPGALAILHKSKIHFCRYSQIAREYYNTHPEQVDLLGEYDGLVLPTSEGDHMLLSNETDPGTITYTVVHEAGHLVSFELMKKSDAVFNEDEIKNGGIAGEILNHHLGNLRATRNKPLLASHPTIYSSTNEMEWFAEAYTLMTLGSNHYEPPYELDTILGEIGFDFKSRLQEFRREDPVGYLLMAKLKQYLSENRLNPEKVLSWTVYQAAEDLVYESGGVIDEKTEQAWFKSEFNFGAEEGYHKWMAEKKASDRLTGLSWINSVQPGFYPVVRDMILTSAELRCGIDAAETGLSDVEMITALAGAALSYPYDPQINEALWELLQCDPRESTQEKYCQGPLFKDREALKRLSDLIEELARRYPEERGFATLQAFSLKQQGRDREAVAAFDKILREDSSFVEVRRAKGACLVRLKRYSEAEEIYKKLKEEGEDFFVIEFAQIYQGEKKWKELVNLLNDEADKKIEGKPSLIMTITKLLSPETLANLQSQQGWDELRQKVAQFTKRPIVYNGDKTLDQIDLLYDFYSLAPVEVILSMSDGTHAKYLPGSR